MAAEVAPPAEHPAGARAFRSRSLTPIQLEDSDEEGCPETPVADEGAAFPTLGRRRRELRGLLWDGVCDQLGLRYRDLVQRLYGQASGDAAEGLASRGPGGSAGPAASATPHAPTAECIEVGDSQEPRPAEEAPSGSGRAARLPAASPAAAEEVLRLLPDGPTSSEASPMAVLAAAGIAGSSPVAARAVGAPGEVRPFARRPDGVAAAQRPAARKTAGAPPADAAAAPLLDPPLSTGGAPPCRRPAGGGVEAEPAAPARRRAEAAPVAPPLDLTGVAAPAELPDEPDAPPEPAARAAVAAAPPPNGAAPSGSTRVGVYHALAQAMERTGRAETALRLQRVQEKALRETLEQAQAALARAGADLESARARKLAARAEYQEELKRWEAHRACEAEAELILQMMEDEDLRETGRAQAPAAAAPAAAPGARPPPPPPPDTVPEGEPAAPDNYYAALAAAVADAEEEGAGSEAPEEGEPRPPSPAGERGGKRRKLEAALDEELRLV